MEVRLTLDDDVVKELLEKSGSSKATDLTKEAMSIFQWAIGEAAKGRVVLSADDKLGDLQRLVTPALSRAARKA